MSDTIQNVLNRQNDVNAPTFALKDALHDDSVVKMPTYIRTNDFTFVFQEIVNTYGIPRYQEFNPAVFNIVTFPFLFGMMFGDVAHGLVLFIFGLYILINNKSISQSKDSMLKTFLGAKYFLTLMGFYAFYCGLIYNDFASIPIPLSKTCYTNQIIPGKNETDGIGVKNKDCSYYFGIDHKWGSSTNDLTFLNSLKMKLAVIVGVLHMTLGIILKGFNCAYFQDYLSFNAEFIPQLLFMVLIFGYMDFMIIFKWLTDWTGRESYAPNITSTLLNLFLKPGKLEGDPEDNVIKIFF